MKIRTDIPAATTRIHQSQAQVGWKYTRLAKISENFLREALGYVDFAAVSITHFIICKFCYISLYQPNFISVCVCVHTFAPLSPVG